MNIYKNYIQEIEKRKEQKFHAKPIDDGKLLIYIDHKKIKIVLKEMLP